MCLTTVRVVGTAPQHGEQAFRLVLDGGRRHVFMKANHMTTCATGY